MNNTFRLLRHRLVRMIAPKLYFQAVNYQYLKNDTLLSVPRPSIRILSEQGQKNLVGAEIGVAAGRNAESIMQTLTMKRLYLIDPYIDYMDGGKLFSSHDTERPIAEAQMRKYGDKVRFLYMTSHEASRCINEPLDFVYIDGCHDYAYVKQDIVDYAPKLREGGLLCGHDFSADYTGVIKAVIEYVAANDLSLKVWINDWWVQVIKK